MARMFKAVLASVVVASVLGGCATTKCADCDGVSCAEPKGTTDTVNAMCVVNPKDAVNPAIPAATWKGQKVGFCCKGCVPKWEKMSDEKKDAAVAKSLKTAK